MRQVLQFLGFVQPPLRVEGGMDMRYHSRVQEFAVDSEAGPAIVMQFMTSEQGRYDNLEFGRIRQDADPSPTQAIPKA